MFPPKNCTGCGACAQCCPVHAIQIQKNKDGFFYPVIQQERCIHCSKCENTCPALHPAAPIGEPPIAYAAYSKCDRIREVSSSGGLFSLLADAVLKQDGLVVGCAMTEDRYAAEHRIISSPGQLHEITGSKYLQSEVHSVFPKVKQALADGRLVLFCGTPCQIVGLHAALSGQNTDRLYTVDVICHGVASPLVWESYVKQLEAERNAKAVSVSFRDKKAGPGQYSLVIGFVDGTEYRELFAKDLFCKGYVSDLFLRSACYDCPSKGPHRLSDMTLGDFWGIDDIDPTFSDGKGCSLVLLNTPKGAALFHRISDDIRHRSVGLNDALRHNPSYSRSSEKRAQRNDFMKRLDRCPVTELLRRSFSRNLLHRCRRKLIGLFGSRRL